MFNQPVTFLIYTKLQDEAALRRDLQEFAIAGGKNVVLSDQWIREIMGDFKLVPFLEKLLDDYGLTLLDSHSPFGTLLDLNAPGDDWRRQMILRHKLSIEIAASLGIKTITIHPGSDRYYPETALSEHRDLIRRSLDELLETAVKCDMVIAVENSMSRSASPNEIIALKKEYPDDHIGFCYDSGHANQLNNGRNFTDCAVRKYWQMAGAVEPEWDDAILEKMLSEVVNCHLHDNDGSSDEHRIPGEGNVAWEKEIPMLKKAPRLQVVQCEVLMRPHYTITQIVRKFEELGNLV